MTRTAAAERAARGYASDPERYNNVRRAYRARVRTAVIQKYGGECACCGEPRIVFLVIDHINGDGAHERRTIGTGYAFYLALYREPVRPGLRVLCHNCNHAVRMGVCPHDKETAA